VRRDGGPHQGPVVRERGCALLASPRLTRTVDGASIGTVPLTHQAWATGPPAAVTPQTG
jgi:hypothetical protein